MIIEWAGLSDKGLKRTSNEDQCHGDPTTGLFLVADGMGGHVGGALASLAVARAFPPLVEREMAVFGDLRDPRAAERMKGIINEISLHLNAKGRDSGDLSGLGSTLVALLIRGDFAMIAHLGDSRAFLFRDQDLQRLTQDHSMMRVLLESGMINPTEMKRHPARNKLTQFVGMDGDTAPDTLVVPLQANDRFLLCSDGLTNMAEEEEILGIFMQRRRAEDTCQRLINLANSAGGADNATVVLVDLYASGHEAS